jgi:hypothetical protein
MSDHEHFDELAALSAGGLLSEQEAQEFHEHAKTCPACLKAQQEYGELVRSGLPMTASPIHEFLQCAKASSSSGTRERFWARARCEGVELPQETHTQPRRLGVIAAAALAAAASLVVGFCGVWIYRTVAVEQSSGTVGQLQKENSALNRTVSQLNQSTVSQQQEIERLRTQLAAASKTAASLRRDSDAAKEDAVRSSSQNVQLPAELENRDKQLEESRKEIQRINQLRADNEASLVAQQVKIAELSDQLRIASATLELERQLTTEGKDIRELLVARQLHVIDVRDTDANGKPGKAFGRVFLSEGKSLTFYAFDLNEDRMIDAKHRFEVWGAQQAKTSSARNLGFLYVDDKSQRRWALKVNNPEVLKEVSSVFVTLEPHGGSSTPSGQAMLYAYLGQPNHP